MPNKTVTFVRDEIGKGQLLCTWDLARPPYMGEHVDAKCSWEIEEGVIVLSTTGVVEQMSHETQTCLIRPSAEANAEIIRAATEESKVEDRPTSTESRPAASEEEQGILRQKDVSAYESKVELT